MEEVYSRKLVYGSLLLHFHVNQYSFIHKRDTGQTGCCYMSRTVLMQWRDGIRVTRLSKRVSGVKFSLKSLNCWWEFATGCQKPPKKPIKECTNCWKGQIRRPP